jgi:hypothetical protein
MGRQHGQASPGPSSTPAPTAILVDHGSLYPALQRLERRGWIAAEWGTLGEQSKGPVLRIDRERLGSCSGARRGRWQRLVEAVAGCSVPKEPRDEAGKRSSPEEIEAHLALEAARLESQGVPAAEARAAARRAFGKRHGRARAVYESRAAWRWVERLRQDTRYAIRTLRASPAFTLTAH